MPEPTNVFATGADERYGYHLLNLLGSLKTNSDIFDRVISYDLGLSAHQRGLLDRVAGIEVGTVPAFAPHWSQGFTWKSWAWTRHNGGEIVFWLDAGDTVLRSLEPALDQIREQGYFVVSQGNALRDIVPSDYWDLYDLPSSYGDKEYVAAGIVGFRVGGEFYDRVVVPVHEDCLAGRSLGFSAGEAAALNRGLQATDAPILRDCKHFRWDQTVFNLRLFSAYRAPHVNDMWRYAGWRSAHDHPEQVIWNHRRHGSMAHLVRVPYAGSGTMRARVFGLTYRGRWWLRGHRKYLTASTYAWKARKIAASLRRERV